MEGVYGWNQKNLGLLCDALRNAFLHADVALRKFQAVVILKQIRAVALQWCVGDS